MKEKKKREEGRERSSKKERVCNTVVLLGQWAGRRELPGSLLWVSTLQNYMAWNIIYGVSKNNWKLRLLFSKRKTFSSFSVHCQKHINQKLGQNSLAAAAKSLQSCPTLCDPIDGSPQGFPVPGILQARTLDWAAISFSIKESSEA